jgi:hypothetical protein
MPTKTWGKHTPRQVMNRLITREIYDQSLGLPTDRSFIFSEICEYNPKLQSNLRSLGCITQVGKTPTGVCIWRTTPLYDEFLKYIETRKNRNEQNVLR